MDDEGEVPAEGIDERFGPRTDGRKRFEYQTRYLSYPEQSPSKDTRGSWFVNRSPWVQIWLEAAYVLFAFATASLALGYVAANPYSATGLSFAISEERWPEVRPFIMAFLGGTLGGSLYAMKWLYHSVAKGWWNRDRVLWRLFTPLLAAGTATIIVVMSASGVLPLFGPALASSAGGATAIAMLVGFFSDRAFSALENTMQGIFGSSENGHADQSPDEAPTDQPKG